MVPCRSKHNNTGLLALAAGIENNANSQTKEKTRYKKMIPPHPPAGLELFGRNNLILHFCLHVLSWFASVVFCIASLFAHLMVKGMF